MFSIRKVIVVYPENYEDLATALQHEISKLDGFDSAVWTLEHYKQNIPTLSGRSYVIFIGNAEENQFTKMYLPQISNIVNIKGSCFGRDGSKAVVFGEGKLEQKSDFEEFKNQLEHGRYICSPKINRSLSIAKFYPPFILGYSIPYSVYRYFKSKSEEKDLCYEQTKLAIENFVMTEMEYWVGNEA